jgi:hypothetical protein
MTRQQFMPGTLGYYLDNKLNKRDVPPYPGGDYEEMAKFCWARRHLLSKWEYDFIDKMSRWARFPERLTIKQKSCIVEIFRRLWNAEYGNQ